jgi:hypothetical protein
MDTVQQFGIVLAGLGLVGTLANWMAQGPWGYRLMFFLMTCFGVILAWPK